MKLDHLPTFTVTGKDSEEYGDFVNQTAKLLKRPYMVVHGIFTKEQWTLEEIQRHYLNATKHNGNMPHDVYWWWKRKQRNETHTTQTKDTAEGL